MQENNRTSNKQVLKQVRLLDVQELDVKDEGGAAGDETTANTAVAIGKVRGDGQCALLTNAHVLKSGEAAKNKECTTFEHQNEFHGNERGVCM